MSIGTARRARIRPFLMAATAVFALLANLAALIAGVTVVFPHLLYIPIVLAGYWYPRRGPVISAIISATYAVMALALTPQDWISIVSRAITLVAIGVLIAFISHQLEAERVRYRELFDHSVAGILVVNGAGVILKANQQAATLVGRDEGELEEGRYRWQLEVAPWTDPLLPANAPDDPFAAQLLQLRLELAWGEGGAGQRLVVESLRLVQPEPGEEL